MRIIVMSDSHRDFHAVLELVEKHREADIFIHLGDGARELEEVAAIFPERKILHVRGNCDYGSDATLAGCFSCGAAKIYYTHGHMYNVKYGLDELKRAAREVQANVVLFGHTHEAMVAYSEGLWLMNPGSLGMPRGPCRSYGVLDVTDTGTLCFINELT